MINYVMIAVYLVYLIALFADHVKLLVVCLILLYVLSFYNLAMS